MAALIYDEVTLFLICVALGLLLSFFYDCICILRLFVSHKDLFVDLEDLLFWLSTAWVTFRVLFAYNKGILRLYAVLGMVLGFLLYHMTISRWLIGCACKLLPFFLKTKKFICKPFAKISRWIRKGLKNLRTQVKMAMKSR